MFTAGRFVIILLICGVIAHVLLGGGLSFLSDYRIWGPTIGSSRQEIILVRDVNNNDEHVENTANDKSNNNGSITDELVKNGSRSDHPFSYFPDIKLVNEPTIDKLANKSTNGEGIHGLTNDKATNTTTNHPTFASDDHHISMAATMQGFLTTVSLNNQPEMRMTPQNQSLQRCPIKPPNLLGPIKVWFDEPKFEELERIYPYLEPGGHGKPKNCLARHRVAVVVPYRDREAHLRILLHNLHSLLTKQQLDYSIFVVEQYEDETFNRAKLMNVGFVEAMKLYDWQCFIFHDVDLLPEDDRNIYSCPEQPRHMSVAIDKFQYKLPYGSIFGGISALKTEHFVKINGFSNDYWGWGGEDDDLSTRVTLAGYKIMRYPAEIARYKMIKHKPEKKNPLNTCRYDLMGKTKDRQKIDGISSLKYERYDLQLKPLFTHIKVKLLEKDSKMRLREEGFKKC